ncbi:hypothetical protein HK19_01010 [Acetobacter persici]|uniref:hypothetical protein n=1 Tax=Acetobacter persici TaxID=1076596 RepID=UPI000A38C492|nr:hypothetical protein [Acetobacter persici]OUI87896.1 hypothetical protein HK19_01010 [Acetobacter persici]
MSKKTTSFRTSIMITKEEALAVQARQIEHYASIYGEWLREAVAKATTAGALESGVEYDMVTINRHIPRGGQIEALIPEKVEAERRIKEGMKEA